MKKIKVFINPGHLPGVDSGAVNQAYGTQEAVINAKVAEWLETMLDNQLFVVKTLQSDNLMGENNAYPNICGTANQWDADLFISIHCNSATPQAEGAEALVFHMNSTAADVGWVILDHVCRDIELVNRGVKARPDLAVLRRTNMPAVLIELGFISNEGDHEKLLTRQWAYAKAITDALKAFYNS